MNTHLLLIDFCVPYRFLQKRMGLLTSLKLNELTLDELYNSREIVLSNIFHAALLQAFRFHSIVKNTFDRKNLNQRFLTQIVYESAGRIGGQVLSITKKYCRGNFPRKLYKQKNLS